MPHRFDRLAAKTFGAIDDCDVERAKEILRESEAIRADDDAAFGSRGTDAQVLPPMVT